jgi:8-oxo-dGTP diphosphatase
MKEEFGIDVVVGEFIGDNSHRYESKTIQLLGYCAVWTGGEFSLNAHAEYKWVPREQLPDFDFAPADIKFGNKLQQENI